MKAMYLAAAGLLALGASATAQTPRPLRFDVRPFVGVFIPTGTMADNFKSATMVGGQAAFEMNRHFHLLGSVGWTHGHNKFGGTDDVTHIWQYDVGMEMGHSRAMTPTWAVRPFLGLGAGGRTYDYSAGNNTTSKDLYTCTAGYGALGAEMQRGVMGVRLEARDYLSCFENPATGKKKTLNDVGISLGFSYHLW